MNKRAEEFVNSKVSELNGLVPLKSEVIKWLIDFASDEVKAINYNRCCTECSDKEEKAFGRGYNLGAKEASNEILSSI